MNDFHKRRNLFANHLTLCNFNIPFMINQNSVMLLVFFCLFLGVKNNGMTALVSTDLVGERIDVGVLEEVIVSEAHSGIQFFLNNVVSEDPGLFTVWDATGSSSMNIRQKVHLTCKSGISSLYIYANIALGLTGDVYFNGVYKRSITKAYLIYFSTFVFGEGDFNGCGENQIYIEIRTTGHTSTKWIWYSVTLSSNELQNCLVCDCPNGLLQFTEQCDDGNNFSHDGCSPQCLVEEGWVCPRIFGIPSVCSSFQQFCGNGFREFYLAAQGCDDGNVEDGDGCSASCQVEEGFVCSGVLPSVCSKCGNLMLDEGEECEDGGAENNDGCSSSCQVEPHYQCSDTIPSLCELQLFCGDGMVGLEESCDDGNGEDEDGCNSDCQVEEGWKCSEEDGPSVCSLICLSNGNVEDGQECDDGNEQSEDGCDGCQVEEGWSCNVTEELISICQQDQQVLCGNGVLDPLNLEECDDGNLGMGDGCDELCRIEERYRCWTLSLEMISRVASEPKPAQSLCFLCGDGEISWTEECDDGNEDDGDGCSSQCTLES